MLQKTVTIDFAQDSTIWAGLGRDSLPLLPIVFIELLNWGLTVSFQSAPPPLPPPPAG